MKLIGCIFSNSLFYFFSCVNCFYYEQNKCNLDLAFESLKEMRYFVYNSGIKSAAPLLQMPEVEWQWTKGGKQGTREWRLKEVKDVGKW